MKLELAIIRVLICVETKIAKLFVIFDQPKLPGAGAGAGAEAELNHSPGNS